MILRADGILGCPIVIAFVIGGKTAATYIHFDKVVTNQVFRLHILCGNDRYTVVTTSVVGKETTIYRDVVCHRAVE